MKLRDFLSFYAEHFDTVEIDSTFYGIPSANAVKGWTLKTPKEFIFSVKVPQIITHEKVLTHCDAEFEQFFNAMNILGEKLGPIVFQFPFFNRWKFSKQSDFLAVLVPFLKKLPADHKFAIEIRNKAWLDVHFADVLREHKVALVLQDLSYMPHPNELAQKFDPVTTDWTYIRWLGDRKGIEALTQTWNKTVIDRTDQLKSWVNFCYQVKRRGVTVYAYANNHYAGHAPATIKQFRTLWYAKGSPIKGNRV
jgi:uncharacterized protein YecE (DUF72 family)